jgi:hypothetical protein
MDDSTNQALSKPLPTAKADDAQGRDVRMQRLTDHMADSLAKDDPFAANLGAVNGDLMLIEYRMRQSLDVLLKEAPRSPEEFQAAMPGVDAYLRVVKQIDRFSQLALKLDSARASE